jgi:DNA recombination protein RmuC
MDLSPLTALLIGLAAGAFVGALCGWLAARSRQAGVAVERLHTEEIRAARLEEGLERELAAAARREEDLGTAQRVLADQFRSMSAEALERNNRSFLDLAETRLKEAGARASGELDQRRQAVEHLVGPLRETLGKVETQLRELESARVSAYSALSEQVGFAQQTSEQLRTQTASLVTALRAPQSRGRWGELQLRRVVEIAGMDRHCDFQEQPSAVTPDGTLRPDLVVRLAGNKRVVVDSKVSLAAYLEAAESDDELVRNQRLQAHARHLKTHVDQLAGKAYWAAFAPAPEFVVLFVPGEAFLAPALEFDPGLLEYAMGRRVMIATPTTLVAMLRTIAYSWQQAALTDNAREVFELGRTLYERLGILGQHVDKLGRSITRVVGDYNAAVGSLESRVLSTARRLADLKVVEAELVTPRAVEDLTRAVTAPELITAAVDARQVRVLPGVAEAEAEDEDRSGDDAGDGLRRLPAEEMEADERYGLRGAGLPRRPGAMGDVRQRQVPGG